MLCSLVRATLKPSPDGVNLVNLVNLRRFSAGGSGDLSLNFSLWSDGFQAIGYQTHAIGKVRNMDADGQLIFLGGFSLSLSGLSPGCRCPHLPLLTFVPARSPTGLPALVAI